MVESDIKDGFVAGGLVTARLSDLFSLEADLLFVKKGSNQTITVPGFPFGDIKVTYRLDYLEIPLLLRTHIFPRAKIQPSLAVGPYAAFLTTKKTLTASLSWGPWKKRSKASSPPISELPSVRGWKFRPEWSS